MLFINPRPEQIHAGLILSAIFIVLDIILISPLTNKIFCSSITKRIRNWKENGLDDYKDRTELFEDIMAFPFKRSIVTCIYFIISSSLLISSLYILPIFNFTLTTCIIAFIPCIACTIDATILARYNSEKICNTYAEELVQEGIDKEYIIKKKNFGMPLWLKTFFYLYVPVISASMLTFLLLLSYYFKTGDYIQARYIYTIKVIAAIFFNVIRCVAFAILYYRHLTINNNKLQATLENILESGIVKNQSSSNIGDQLQYNIYLFNVLVKRFDNLIGKATEIGEHIKETTHELSSISKKLSSTSIDQSANVKEILATMEDSNELSLNVAAKINQVSLGTEITKENVEIGFNELNQNISQMKEIQDSNSKIITGIEDLTLQINKVDNIMTIIKDIADQTRIIAFNAELEAVSAGEEGRNFHIVATEIRRLANSTMNSINEIQNYIANLKAASDDLISTSEKGTTAIEEENNTVRNLENHFNLIKQSAEASFQKTSEITSIVQQQTTAFGQIILTLRQISTSIENFTESTGNLSSISNELQTISSNLENIQITENTN